MNDTLKRRDYEVSYVLLFLALYFVSCIIGPLVMQIGLILLAMVWLMANRTVVPVLLSAVVAGNETTSLAIIILWLVSVVAKEGIPSIATLKLNRYVLISCMILCISTFIGQIRLESCLNSIISVVYLLLVLFVFWGCAKTYLDSAEYWIVRFSIIEALATVPTVLRVGFNPGDWFKGTLSDAHSFGLVCAIFITYMIASHVYRNLNKQGQKQSNKDSWLKVALVPVLLLMIYLSDTKATIAAGFVAVIIYIVVWSITRSRMALSITFLAVCFLTLLLPLYLSIPNVKDSYYSSDSTISRFVVDYAYNDYGFGVNKFIYFSGTAQHLIQSGYWIAGYGLGSYGSRSANLVGYDYTYREPSYINRLIPSLTESHMLPEYQEYASKINNNNYQSIRFVSAVLTYPFSSILALVAETGIVGIGLVAYLLAMMRIPFPGALVVALFAGACVVDLYFEHINLISLIAVTMFSSKSFVFSSTR